MAIDPTSAIAAYVKAGESKSAPGGADEAGSFGSLLEQTISDAIGTGKAGEARMADSATGKADLVDVVTAVTQAEVTLETVIAIRDRMISAYQEVMRMPV
ncbi:MAG: flagellar hook-basal body complex protein FliE [Alphaproteobacteria bacterium]|nr:flagellar hook-basal body complex protein FliE [Alphaproteobacteria bacterium]